MSDWFGLAISLLSLALVSVVLVRQVRTLRQIRRLSDLAATWSAMADHHEATGSPEAAEWLRYCAYWLRAALVAGPRNP